jgi:hypothetical protein
MILVGAFAALLAACPSSQPSSDAGGAGGDAGRDSGLDAGSADIGSMAIEIDAGIERDAGRRDASLELFDASGFADAGAFDAGGPCAVDGTDCILETTGAIGVCCSGTCGPPLDRWQINCGACGHACPVWQECQASQCVDTVTCAASNGCQFPDGTCCGVCCP